MLEGLEGWGVDPAEIYGERRALDMKRTEGSGLKFIEDLEKRQSAQDRSTFNKYIGDQTRIIIFASFG